MNNKDFIDSEKERAKYFHARAATARLAGLYKASAAYHGQALTYEDSVKRLEGEDADSR